MTIFSHRITLASGSETSVESILHEKRVFICKVYLRVKNLSWHWQLVTYTHFKVAVHPFPETKASGPEFPNSSSWAGVIYYGKPTHYFLVSGHHHSIFCLSPSTPPNPFEVKASVIFVRCRNTHSMCMGCSYIHTCRNLNIQKSPNPCCCIIGLDLQNKQKNKQKTSICKEIFPYLSLWGRRVPSQAWDASNTLSPHITPKTKPREAAPPGVTSPARAPGTPSPLLSRSHMNAKQGRKPMGPHSTSSAMSQLEKP